jgi:hypothetical protein
VNGCEPPCALALCAAAARVARSRDRRTRVPDDRFVKDIGSSVLDESTIIVPRARRFEHSQRFSSVGRSASPAFPAAHSRGLIRYDSHVAAYPHVFVRYGPHAATYPSGLSTSDPLHPTSLYSIFHGSFSAALNHSCIGGSSRTVVMYSRVSSDNPEP